MSIRRKDGVIGFLELQAASTPTVDKNGSTLLLLHSNHLIISIIRKIFPHE